MSEEQLKEETTGTEEAQVEAAAEGEVAAEEEASVEVTDEAIEAAD